MSTDHDLLIQLVTKVEYLCEQMDCFVGACSEHRKEHREMYVSKNEFTPVRLISYGLVGGIGVAVLNGLLNKVL